MPLREHSEGLLVVLRQRFHAKVRLIPAHKLCRVLKHREVAKPQKVHFQKSQLLKRRHRVLTDNAVVVSGEGDVLVNRLLGDDHARRVHGGVARHALKRLGNVDEPVQLLVAVVHFAQGLGEAQRLVYGHVQRLRACRHLLCHRIGLGIADGQSPSYVAYRGAGCHRAEGDDLRHMVAAVEAVDVVDDLAAPVDAEVHVDIRHGDAFGVQKALEEQAVFYRINVGDVQAVGHDAARGTAAAGADGDAVALCVADEVGHDEKVIHKAHLVYHFKLVFKLRVNLRPGGEALREALFTELFQVFVAVVLPFGELEARQVVVPELKVE